MLFDTSYKSNEIVCFKLVNGDEIVAKIVEQTATGWKINKPCTVVPSHQGLGLVQALFSADINKNVELKSEHVMMHSVTLKALEDHYITTTTGIAVGNGSIIT
jgi:hypothetical protein